MRNILQVWFYEGLGMSLGEIGNAYGIFVERLWGAATRTSRRTWQKNRVMCHGKIACENGHRRGSGRVQ
jgi:hypothetical protein